MPGSPFFFLKFMSATSTLHQYGLGIAVCVICDSGADILDLDSCVCLAVAPATSRTCPRRVVLLKLRDAYYYLRIGDRALRIRLPRRS